MDNSVPNPLKRLVKMVMRGFYSIEHVLIMDILIRKPCMKDDDIESLLRFDKKQIRSITNQLKNEKMLKSKLRMETGPDGKMAKQNYHYINYQSFVNVVKYKLDHMRRKIETEERDISHRSSFICTECKKTYTDLEADQLYDMTSGEFKCTYCYSLVEEDPSVLPKADSRLIMAKFNETMEPLYILLKEVEDIILPSDILEPEPYDLRHNINNGNLNHNDKNDPRRLNATVTIDGHDPSASNRRHGGFDDHLDPNFSIKIENTDATDGISTHTMFKPDPDAADDPKSSIKSKANRENLPIWLSGSTVYDELEFESTGPSAKDNRRISETMNGYSSNSFNNTNGLVMDESYAKEVLELLLQHELDGHQSTSSTADAVSSLNFMSSTSTSSFNHNHNNNNRYHSMGDNINSKISNPYGGSNGLNNHAPNGGDEDNEDVEMQSDTEDNNHETMSDGEGPRIRIGSSVVPLDQITEDDISRMSREERDHYTKLTQEVYSLYYCD